MLPPSETKLAPQPLTDLPPQVEFYFSDSNLPTDKFMWESTGGEENKPMSLKTICNFKRMRMFQPYSAVVAALRASESLEVEGEVEGEETVKRKRAYVSSNEAQKARLASSVYAKGFGDEEPSTQFDIEAFFANHGHVKHVKLRRTAEELFKGSVFVEFETAEEADAFVKLDPKPTWKGHDLLIMKKKEYLDEKNRQIKEGIIEPNTTRRNAFFEGKDRGGSRGGARGGRGRGGHDGAKSGEWKDRDQKNGFKGGRGGRGRGRGGRGFRGGRGGGRDRDNRDNKGRDEKKSEDTRANPNEYVSPLVLCSFPYTNNPHSVQMPTIQTPATNGNKRAREDDGAGAPAAKKVDTKTEAVAAQ
jgi:lupus La protein